ncbi:MAG TPA: hypothetical protein VEH06_05890 [Candidatus Bathyarchaeia archaeon]|nr:hypothetical protein [Candidatus Bathyarchaeia archaeon]
MVAMVDRLLLLHVFLITIIIIFFLFTLSCSIFFTMVIFTSKISAELAGNLMVLALVPPSILTVLFLNKVAGGLYDRLHVRITPLRK